MFCILVGYPVFIAILNKGFQLKHEISSLWFLNLGRNPILLFGSFSSHSWNSWVLPWTLWEQEPRSGQDFSINANHGLWFSSMLACDRAGGLNFLLRAVTKQMAATLLNIWQMWQACTAAAGCALCFNLGAFSTNSVGSAPLDWGLVKSGQECNWDFRFLAGKHRQGWDRLCNLQDLVQIKMWDSLLKNIEEFQGDNSTALLSKGTCGTTRVTCTWSWPWAGSTEHTVGNGQVNPCFWDREKQERARSLAEPHAELVGEKLRAHRLEPR